MFTGDLTWRELASYVAGLSPQSATRTALRRGVAEPTAEEVLLADLYDLVARHDWHFALANTPENKRQPKSPRPYPRRWLQQHKQKGASPQRAEKLERARRRRRERQQAITAGLIT